MPGGQVRVIKIPVSSLDPEVSVPNSSPLPIRQFPHAPKELKPDGWRLESPEVLRLLEKLRKAGKPSRICKMPILLWN